MLHVDDLIEPRPEQILLPRLAPFPWPHRTLRSSPLSSRESRLEIRGNPPREFARKSTPNNQFPANPIAEIPAISIADQLLRNISRTTSKGFDFVPRPVQILRRDCSSHTAAIFPSEFQSADANSRGVGQRIPLAHSCSPPPHLSRDIDRELQLGPLFFLGEDVALFR